MAAHAQKYEISPLAVYQRMSRASLGSISGNGPKDDDTRFKNGYGYGVRFTLNTRGYYGHEFGYILGRPAIETKLRLDAASDAVTLRQEKIKLQTLSYNFLIYFMPAGERWRPYITGGVQGQQFGAPKFTEWPTTSGSRTVGGNYGGGLKLKLFSHALVRFDVRHYIGGKPYDLTFQEPKTTGQLPASGGLIRQLEGTVGFGITF
jgi:hypothetical protein